jgi:hypothetical protein
VHSDQTLRLSFKGDGVSGRGGGRGRCALVRYEQTVRRRGIRPCVEEIEQAKSQKEYQVKILTETEAGACTRQLLSST